MAERIFESAFHKRYVGETEGIIEETHTPIEVKHAIKKTTVEEVLAEYRRYVGDPNAELPEELRNSLLI